jgi:hypothetical protein
VTEKGLFSFASHKSAGAHESSGRKVVESRSALKPLPSSWRSCVARRKTVNCVPKHSAEQSGTWLQLIHGATYGSRF